MANLIFVTGTARLPAYLSEHDSPVKRRILSAALRLFVEHGLAETTVRDIAREAGCTNPALFKHFESKEALALHLFECCYHSLFQIAALSLAAHKDFERRHRSLIEAYVHALYIDSAAVLFVQENLRHFWPKTHLAIRKHSILELIREMLLAGRAQSAVTSAVDIEFLMICCVGTLQQFARMWYFNRFRGPESEAVEQLNKILHRAVAP